MELLPCPFCGGDAYIEQAGNRRQSTIYECGSCGCRLETGEEFNHGKRWNERAESEEITRLRAALEWQPIATAPKNEFVLLAGPSGYTTIETVFATGRMCSDYHVGRWIDHANDDLTDWGFEPTHWMPLPKAPTMQEDKP